MLLLAGYSFLANIKVDTNVSKYTNLNRYLKLKMCKLCPRTVYPNLSMGIPSQALGDSPRNFTVNIFTNTHTHIHTSSTIKQIDKEPRRSNYHPMKSYKEKNPRFGAQSVVGK